MGGNCNSARCVLVPSHPACSDTHTFQSPLISRAARSPPYALSRLTQRSDLWPLHSGRSAALPCQRQCASYRSRPQRIDERMAPRRANPRRRNVHLPAASHTHVPYASYPVAAVNAYPDPPNLHWAVLLLLEIFTCSLFRFVWNLVIAHWLKRVQP